MEIPVPVALISMCRHSTASISMLSKSRRVSSSGIGPKKFLEAEPVQFTIFRGRCGSIFLFFAQYFTLQWLTNTCTQGFISWSTTGMCQTNIGMKASENGYLVDGVVTIICGPLRQSFTDSHGVPFLPSAQKGFFFNRWLTSWLKCSLVHPVKVWLQKWLWINTYTCHF